MAYRILVVDDEPALQRMVGEILAQGGYCLLYTSRCV